MNWIKENKFWTGAIILFLIGSAIIMCSNNNEFAVVYGQSLAFYLVIGLFTKVIIKLVKKRKEAGNAR